MGEGSGIGMALGAGLGTLIAPGIGTAIGAGLGGAVGGSIDAGNANKDAAAAQGDIAKAQLAQQREAAKFAAPTSAELETLGNQIKFYDQAYATSKAQIDTLQQQVTQTYGANIVALGSQLYKQATGGESDLTKSAQAQVDRQRQQTQDQLVKQLGPGALTSSAGIQAMANFDFQANQYLTNVKSQSVSNLVSQIGGLQGSQSSAVSGINSINGSLSNMLSNIQGTQFNLQNRQYNAAAGITQYSGANYVQPLQEARASAQQANDMIKLGTSVATAGISGAFGKTAAPTTSPTSITDSTFAAPTLGDSFNSNVPGSFSSNPFGNMNLTPQAPTTNNFGGLGFRP